MVDKNLFLYDLAVVAIMKNEGPYVKEWLDYHLLAGVDHFYIYDNESPDNQKDILQPYIDAGIVTYTFYPGQGRQYESYNDAFKKFKYFCRYMAVIDGDEFIFPKSKPTIAEIVDEFLLPNPHAAALGANWIMYGSNHHDNADYNHGVLERFLAHEKEVNIHVKTIANPRKVNYFPNPHYAVYFSGSYSVNEAGEFFSGPFNDPGTVDKIQVNHYHSKSREEWTKKVGRGTADNTPQRSVEGFSHDNDNDVFDVSILKYRDERRSALIPEDAGIEHLFPSKQINYSLLTNALLQNLFSTTIKGAAPNLFEGKMETFLTCLNLTSYLREKFIDDTAAKFFEEASLNAIYKAFFAGNLTAADLLLLVNDMPKILKMDYPIVENIREACIGCIPQIMANHRMIGHWQEFNELDNTLALLKSFK